MTRSSASWQDKIGEFSADQRELLRLLRAKAPRRIDQIKSVPRSQCVGPVRFPASPGQRRLWFIDQMLAGDIAGYQIPIPIRLRGPLQPQVLQRALDTIVERHETLRTVFVYVDGELWQEVSPAQPFQLSCLDACEDEVRLHKLQEVQTKFDLRTGPLVRGRLLRVQESEHVLLVTLHHIIIDGWSIRIFIRELLELYSAYHAGLQNPLPPLPIQYGDFVQWQRQQSQAGQSLDRQLAYWRARLESAAPHLELPTDHPRPAVQSYRGENVVVAFGELLTRKIKAFAQRNEVTLFMTLYAGWAILLSRLSNQQDVIIGSPIANRHRPEVEGVIGLFVNTLALRVAVDPEASVRDFLAQVKDVVLGAFDHQSLPFQNVIEAVQPDRSVSRSALFQAMFVLHNEPHAALRMADLTVTMEEDIDEHSILDLFLSLEERGAQLVGSINYTADLFDRTTIERWVKCLEVLLDGLTADTGSSLGALPILPEYERQQLTEVFNATARDYPHDRSIHELFEERAAGAPGAVAVVCGEKVLTYAELNAQANQLARYLKDAGVTDGEYVPVIMSRGVPMLIAQLAILKAGAAYVPVDPGAPAERQRFLIQDCAAKRVLAQGAEGGTLVYETAMAAAAALPRTNLGLASGSAASAYVMYTSGSTGTPRGVDVPHRAVVRLVINNGYTNIGPQDRIAHCSNPAFDASTFEIWGALLSGASVLVVPHTQVLDAGTFATTLVENEVTVLWLTVGLFNQYVEALQPVFSRLRYLLVGGDVVEPRNVRRVLQESPPQYLLNGYGPTECTTFSATYLIENVAEDAERIPIGRPIGNTTVHILDTQRQPVPMGVAGEIYIGGAGVARGYLNLPGLTEERFIADPFSTEPNSRLYKTGDLGRWRPDGNVEYLGRNDFQVKIRGFRIELGEIEARLLDHPLVKDAAVTAREDQPGAKRLTAYVVPQAAAQGLNADSLRAHLKVSLPDYMMPGAFVLLEQLPLTANGKLDRRALPVPQLSAYARREYEAPRGAMEETLAELWQALLKLDRVGRQDNFFELGGHSLLIVQLMERLRQRGLFTEVRQVFDSPTLVGLARTLVSRESHDFAAPANRIPADCTVISPQMLPLVELTEAHIELIAATVPGGMRNIQDVYPLTPAQQGMLFHHLLDKEKSDAYGRHILLALSSRERVGALIAALEHVIERHDVLRTAVLWEHLPAPVQVVYRRVDLSVAELMDVDCIKRMGPDGPRLDLRRAPLLRLEVFPQRDGAEWHALIHTHHLVFDNQSLPILLEEVFAHLRGAQRSLPVPAQYREYVAQSLAQAGAQDTARFFKGKLSDIDEPCAPFGLLNVQGDGSQALEIRAALDSTLAGRLRSQARRLGVGAAALFHAAWALVVARTSGRDDAVFGTVLLGRMQSSMGARRMMGMFINTLPLRIRLQDKTARQLVEHTHRELADLLAYEQASLAEAQQCSGVSGAIPLFSSLLNFRRGGPDIRADSTPADGVKILARPGRTNYPLVLSVDDRDSVFDLSIDTDARLQPRRVLEYLQTTLQGLIEALERSLQTLALHLPVLPENERCLVLEGFNTTTTAFPQDRLIQQIFEAEVEAAPNAVAVTCDDDSLTYAGLNNKANQLARYLISRGARPGECIPILMPRSAQMVIAQLAVLKAGAAYVPIDPQLPGDRQAFMIRDCSARRVITAGSVGEEPLEWIRFDSIPKGLPASNPELARTADSPAYVMYTSGSTGIPKGVVIPHRGVVRLVRNCGYADILPQDCIAHSSNPAFDASTFEVWAPLLNGARMLIMPQPVVLDPRRLAERVREQGVSILFQTTALFNQQMSAAPEVLAGLRYALFGGESCDVNAVRKALTVDGLQNLLHVYGPTEVTTYTTFHRVTSVAPDAHSIPIGRPISNTRVYLLNKHRQPVPVGVTGELYIGGAGVAIEYLNRPELTTERFIADPFSTDSAARLYRSGDLGQWQPDGAIEFLGREDGQIKLRGFRIELGEIEAHLLRHPRVSKAVVILREDTKGDKRLVAYWVWENGLDVKALREYLQARVPEYMVPSAFVALSAVPLTANGKVDRRALPIPDAAAYSKREFAAPKGAIQQSLAHMWCDILHLERVGRNDDFFESGGHSLHGIKLIGLISEQFAVHLSVAAVFQHPTIELMAAAIAKLQAKPDSGPVASGAVLAPLAFSQLAHWNWYNLGERPALRQIALAVCLRGSLDLHALRRSVWENLRRHDALRTRIVLVDGHPMQEIVPPWDFELEVIDLRQLHERQRDIEVQQWIRRQILEPIDVREPNLFGIRLLELSPTERVLILTLEHMISDMFSARLLLRDILTGYARAEPLQPVALQFHDYATWQADMFEAYRAQHGRYWDERLLPCGRLRFPRDADAVGTRGWGTVSFEIEPDLKIQLGQWSRNNKTTLPTTVLTAYVAALLRWCGVTDAVIRYQSDGRNHQRFQQVVGYFATPLYLRIELRSDDSFLDLLRRTVAALGDAHEHADFSYFAARTPRPDITRNPLFNWVPMEAMSTECTPVPFEHPIFESLELDNEPGIVFFDQGDRVVGQVEFPAREFSAQGMQSFAHTVLAALHALLEE